MASSFSMTRWLALLAMTGLCGAAWSGCSKRLRDDGDVEATGGASPAGGEGGALPDGGAGSAGTAACESHVDCIGATPFCGDGGNCVPCTEDEQCVGFSPASPRCTASGACGECSSNAHCENSAPICTDRGLCVPCTSHDQCSSLVCGDSGECVSEERVVYALAGTGAGSTCSRTFPCRRPALAAAKLSSEVPYLVFLPTTRQFENAEPIVVPEGVDATVLANGVAFAASPSTAISVIGSSLRIIDADISGATGSNAAAIACSDGGNLVIEDSRFDGNRSALLVTGCNVNVQRSHFLAQTGVAVHAACAGGASCASAGENSALVIERSLFEGNWAVIYTEHSEALFRNNVLVNNGYPVHQTIADFRGSAVFSYNTVYRNGVACTHTGLLRCPGSAGTSAVTSSNIFLESFHGSDCPDQVYYCENISHSLNEIPWPGVNNSDADPMLTNPAGGDFTPLPGSPAIDAGDPEFAPEVDYFGNPRNVGAGPDIGAIEVQSP